MDELIRSRGWAARYFRRRKEQKVQKIRKAFLQELRQEPYLPPWPRTSAVVHLYQVAHSKVHRIRHMEMPFMLIMVVCWGVFWALVSFAPTDPWNPNAWLGPYLRVGTAFMTLLALGIGITLRVRLPLWQAMLYLTDKLLVEEFTPLATKGAPIPLPCMEAYSVLRKEALRLTEER